MQENTKIEIEQIKTALINKMTDFIKHVDDEYTQNDIAKLEMIIDSFIYTSSELSQENLYVNICKDTVRQLNKLNNHVEGCMINPYERAELIKIFSISAKSKGFDSDDLKECIDELREW